MATTEIQYARSLYVDLEMTCWHDGIAPEGFTKDIIQIGLVEVDTISLTVRRTKSYFVRPKKYEITKYCTDLTGITDTDIRKYGRPLTEVFANIVKEFGPKNKLAYAWGSDQNVLERESLANNCANPFCNGVIDLAVMFRSTFVLSRRMALKNAVEYLHLPWHGTAHNALDDAVNTANIHCEVMRRARNFSKNEGI